LQISSEIQQTSTRIPISNNIQNTDSTTHEEQHTKLQIHENRGLQIEIETETDKFNYNPKTPK